MVDGKQLKINYNFQNSPLFAPGGNVYNIQKLTAKDQGMRIA
jgi:hypothetical protein